MVVLSSLAYFPIRAGPAWVSELFLLDFPTIISEPTPNLWTSAKFSASLSILNDWKFKWMTTQKPYLNSYSIHSLFGVRGNIFCIEIVMYGTSEISFCITFLCISFYWSTCTYNCISMHMSLHKERGCTTTLYNCSLRNSIGSWLFKSTSYVWTA